MCARRDFPSLVCVGFGVNTVVVVFAFFDAEGRPVRVPKKAPRTKAITGWTRLDADPATDADTVRGPAFVFGARSMDMRVNCVHVRFSLIRGGTRARARTDPVMQMDVDVDEADDGNDGNDGNDADDANDDADNGSNSDDANDADDADNIDDMDDANEINDAEPVRPNARTVDALVVVGSPRQRPLCPSTRL